MLIRRCVACGYDGALLRGGEAERCARCGCDLMKRPAKSYAEMEGLFGLIAVQAPQPPDEFQPRRIVRRWAAFFVLSLLAMIGLLSLAAAAFSAV